MKSNYRYYTERELSRREVYISRTATVRRERLIIAAIFSIVMIISIMFFSTRVNAENFNKESDSTKMYKSVTIYLGDTFESIAEEYMSDEYSSEAKYIDEVLSINGMTKASKLIPGNNIIIPYYMSKSIDTGSVIEFSLVK